MKKLSDSNLTLYGVAIAVIPVASSTQEPSDSAEPIPKRLKFICTPISVSAAHPERFDVLQEPPAFKDTCDATDTGKLMDCVTRMTDTIGNTVDLQKASLAANGMESDYQPVALRIGQDSRNPVLSEPLFIQIFGHHLIISDETPDDVIAAKAKREVFATQCPDKVKEFEATSSKLSGLLGECNLKWGSYSPGVEKERINPRTGKIKRNADWIVDSKLAELQPLFENGDAEARRKIMNIARHEGKRQGKIVTGNPYIFKQDKGDYLQWDPSFRQAHDESYDLHYKGQYTRTLKRNFDPPNPPFTDPCADQVRDQLEIALKKRFPEEVGDEPEHRDTIRDLIGLGHSGKSHSHRRKCCILGHLITV